MKYRFLAYWQMSAFVTVEAGSLKEAEDKASAGPLPDNGDYVDGSWELALADSWELALRD